MRLRFKPYAAPELAACAFHVAEPRSLLGQWNASFARPAQPLYLELGCGKGGFLAQQGVQHSDINYIGIDLTEKVLILAKRNVDRAYAAAEKAVDNVKILTHDIERIRFMMNENDIVSRIYINFCNPWNKKNNHTKHRLTHPRQLLQYRTFLAEQGEIYFKCDDENLYDDTLLYLAQAGFTVTWQTRDLHAQEPAWNIRTEHEAMFAAEGIPIKALIAQKTAF
ncbi:MAG: tRNA (guanosine(46)-N7)-methyltransferase TrmB [Ruthenibacterium sp.]